MCRVHVDVVPPTPADAGVHAECESGRHRTPRTVRSTVDDVEASKLARHPKIALRLGQFRVSKTAKAILTLEAHMSELQRLRDAARTAGQMSAAITAEVKRGELMRFYVKKVESAQVNEFSHMSDEELEAFIWDGVAVLRGGANRE